MGQVRRQRTGLATQGNDVGVAGGLRRGNPGQRLGLLLHRRRCITQVIEPELQLVGDVELFG